MMDRLVVAVAAVFLVSSAATAQVPAGGEFRVNTHTIDDQIWPSIAGDAAGNFVVVWESQAQLGPPLESDVFGQRYDAAGNPLGAEFLVNETTTHSQYFSAVAADAKGNFVVTWTTHEGYGDAPTVFARRFDASGAPRGGEFPVDSSTTNGQRFPAVAVTGSGGFVITWDAYSTSTKWDIYAQRFDARGTKMGTRFRVNTSVAEEQHSSSVAADAAGGFVVVWNSSGFSPSFSSGIYAQRFDAAGVPLGAEIEVKPATGPVQALGPKVALGRTGNFMVAWSDDSDGSYNGISARRYAWGAPTGAEFRVNTYTTGYQQRPDIAADAAGNFAILWDSGRNQDGSEFGVYGQRFDASGARRGAEFRVNAYTPGSQGLPVLASDRVGNIAAAWISGNQDGGDEGVYGRRFGGIVPAALAVDPSASGGSDGNRVLEPGETVDVRPAWRNVNGAAQTFDATVLGFAGPPAAGVGYQLLDGTGAYGTVPNGATASCTDCYSVRVGFTGNRPGLHWDATLTERLTPDVLGQTMPWALHVGDSFADVPRTSPFYPFVETLLHRGVTAGCTSGVYCASAATTREQMAAFVLLAKEGGGYAPARCSPPNLFADVPETSPFCDVIEELARRGVVAGCGGGNYCPTAMVAREQMPVFVLRTLDPSFTPPACSAPMFGDVPASSPFCPWIEELARRGVVTGCGGGNYCPAAPVTREQMAVFLTVTFGLTLYGP